MRSKWSLTRYVKVLNKVSNAKQQWKSYVMLDPPFIHSLVGRNSYGIVEFQNLSHAIANGERVEITKVDSYK